MRVKCPRCGQETSLGRDNPFRPFCSERCKIIDLGHWVSSDYRIPTRAPDEEEDGRPTPAPGTQKS